MFTGIITDRGVVKAIEAPDRTVADARFTFETAYDTAAIPEGASIACSGVCLTVVDKGSEGGRGWFAADVSGETLARSTLGDWRPGTPVNFERPLKLGDELGGLGVLERTFFGDRSEEHTSELQSLMRISYAVFCLTKKKSIKRTSSTI